MYFSRSTIFFLDGEALGVFSRSIGFGADRSKIRSRFWRVPEQVLEQVVDQVSEQVPSKVRRFRRRFWSVPEPASEEVPEQVSAHGITLKT